MSLRTILRIFALMSVYAPILTIYTIADRQTNLFTVALKSLLLKDLKKYACFVSSTGFETLLFVDRSSLI
jgi:hypothetical protein